MKNDWIAISVSNSEPIPAKLISHRQDKYKFIMDNGKKLSIKQKHILEVSLKRILLRSRFLGE